MSDENLIIETPERVELSFALASLGNRFIACAIDHVIQVILIITVAVSSYLVSGAFRTFGRQVFSKAASGDIWTIAVGIAATYILVFGYFVVFEILLNGQTPGKRLLKLRVIKDDGRPISAFEAFSRGLLRIADGFPWPFYSVGICSVFASLRSQRLGDFVAGTVVIKERVSEAPSFNEVFHTEDDGDAGFDIASKRLYEPIRFKCDVQQLNRKEIDVVEAFLRRRLDLPHLPRQWMAWRIAMPLLESLRPAFESGEYTYEAFLEELLSKYRQTGNF